MNGEKYRLPNKKLEVYSITLFSIRKGINYIFKDVKKALPDEVINVTWDDDAAIIIDSSETVPDSQIYGMIYSKQEMRLVYLFSWVLVFSSRNGLKDTFITSSKLQLMTNLVSYFSKCFFFHIIYFQGFNRSQSTMKLGDLRVIEAFRLKFQFFAR